MLFVQYLKKVKEAAVISNSEGGCSLYYYCNVLFLSLWRYHESSGETRQWRVCVNTRAHRAAILGNSQSMCVRGAAFFTRARVLLEFKSFPIPQINFHIFCFYFIWKPGNNNILHNFIYRHGIFLDFIPLLNLALIIFTHQSKEYSNCSKKIKLHYGSKEF